MLSYFAGFIRVIPLRVSGLDENRDEILEQVVCMNGESFTGEKNYTLASFTIHERLAFYWHLNKWPHCSLAIILVSLFG